MDDIHNRNAKARRGRTSLSPVLGGPDSLNLQVATAAQGPHPAAALVLHGAFRLSVDITGRYDAGMPAPIVVAAVSHRTGQAWLRDLSDDEDWPPRYLGEDAAPSVQRLGPNGPSSAGIEEIGYFSVHLDRHLGLPAAPDSYDVFLWLGELLSEVVQADMPGAGGALARVVTPAGARDPAAARVTPAAPSKALALFAARHGAAPAIAGRCGASRVSLLAVALHAGATASMVLAGPDGGGLAFELAPDALFPGWQAPERMLVVALAGGARSAPLDLRLDPPQNA